MKTVLIGNGYWGSKLARYIPEYFDIVYIADSKFDRNIIWNSKDITSVIIATSINTHYEIAKKALENGKHVFIEKPVTLKYEEAIELREIARKNNLKIGVEYTQTFSPSIKKMISLLPNIGEVEYIEMSTKHLGRFMEYDVHWLLASHHLSILDMIMDLDNFIFQFNNHVYNWNYEDICTTGSILFYNSIFHGRIDVSTNFPDKEMIINIYGENGTIKYNPYNFYSLSCTLYNKKYKALSDELTQKETMYRFDEKNNLRYAIQYFYNLLNDNEISNIDTAIKITKILEKRGKI